MTALRPALLPRTLPRSHGRRLPAPARSADAASCVFQAGFSPPPGPLGTLGYLVDLQSQLAASGWPYHLQALVTAPPTAPAHLTFHRELQGGTSTIVVSWAAPAAGQPVPTGSTVTGSGCGTLQSSNAADARFTAVPKSATTCTATVSLLNSAGSSPPTTGSARV